MFIISQSNYKLKIISYHKLFFSDCSASSGLIEVILTVKCKMCGNKVNKVCEIDSNGSFYSGFIKPNEFHAILQTQLLVEIK